MDAPTLLSTRRLRAVSIVLLLAVMASACGSRRADDEFVNALGDPNFEGFSEFTSGDGVGVDGSPSGGGEPARRSSAAGGPGTGAPTPGPVESAGGSSESAGGSSESAGGSSDSAGTGGDASPGTGRSDGSERAPNTASDVGVTETSIKIGNIVSRGGPLGPQQFAPSYFGANAFFEDLNAQGGVNGRTIEFITCDDREESSENRRCAELLIGDDIFAFVSNNSRVHFGGSGLIAENGVPDVGGQAVGYEYFKYPTHFALYSTIYGHYPREGTTGWDGTLSQNDAVYNWVAQQGITSAAVLYYSIPISKSEGLNMANGLRNYGVEVTEFEVNPALPGFDSIVARMQDENVDFIINSIDGVGNQNLCRSMDRAGFEVDIHMVTVAGWTRAVGNDFSSPCRTNLFSFGFAMPGSRVDHPEVQRYRAVTQQLYGPGHQPSGHQWGFEGWISAKMFTEAVASMGPDVTRQGLMDWYRGLDNFDLGGLISPGGYQPFRPVEGGATTGCFSVVRWSEGDGDFVEVEPASHCIPGEWDFFEPVYEP